MNERKKLSATAFWVRASSILSLLVVAWSWTCLAVWAFGSEHLRALAFNQMKFRTSVLMSLISLSLWIATLTPKSRALRFLKIASAASVVGLTIGAVCDQLYATNLLVLIDQLFRLDSSVYGPAGIAANTSFCFFVLACGILSMDRETWISFLFQRLVIAAGCVGLFGISSYLFKRLGYNAVASFTVMNPVPAAAFFLMALGIFLARPRVGIVGIVINKHPSGMFARRMMVAAFFCPPVLGWLGMLAVEAGVFSSATAWALVSLICTTLFASLVWQSAETLRTSEEKIIERELQFRSMANSIPQLAWTARPDGKLNWFNQRWLDFTGQAPSEAVETGWTSALDPKVAEATYNRWTQAVQAGESWEDLIQIRSREGDFRWFLSRAMPLRNESGEIVQWFGSNTDVDDQRRAEAELSEAKLSAERANASKTQFLANMSHEIRTPIGAIMGFTELLLSPHHNSLEKAKFMQVISNNSHQLLRLIDDILDLSKVDAGKIAVEKTKFNFVDFLADVRAVSSLKASSKNISFEIKFASDLPEFISTDSLRLKQVLSNVVGNAIKFTDQGEVILEVRMQGADLEFSVHDTGAGLSEEAQGRLFQSFSQADPTLTRKYGGTGLGLFLSKRLCEFLGGGLTLSRSTVGVGSTFKAVIRPDEIAGTIFVGAKNLQAARPTAVDRASAGELLSGLHVLVVDDSPDNRTLIKTYLKRTGAFVEMAEDGLEGVSKALASRPDVILMDVQMPRLDGRSATKQLREAGFLQPIIALTAHAMREERDRCFESGCTDYLTKPILRNVLIEHLARYHTAVQVGDAEMRSYLDIERRVPGSDAVSISKD